MTEAIHFGTLTILEAILTNIGIAVDAQDSDPNKLSAEAAATKVQEQYKAMGPNNLRASHVNQAIWRKALEITRAV